MEKYFLSHCLLLFFVFSEKFRYLYQAKIERGGYSFGSYFLLGDVMRIYSFLVFCLCSLFSLHAMEQAQEPAAVSKQLALANVQQLIRLGQEMEFASRRKEVDGDPALLRNQWESLQACQTGGGSRDDIEMVLGLVEVSISQAKSTQEEGQQKDALMQAESMLLVLPETECERITLAQSLKKIQLELQIFERARELRNERKRREQCVHAQTEKSLWESRQQCLAGIYTPPVPAPVAALANQTGSAFQRIVQRPAPIQTTLAQLPTGAPERMSVSASSSIPCGYHSPVPSPVYYSPHSQVPGWRQQASGSPQVTPPYVPEEYHACAGAPSWSAVRGRGQFSYR